MAKTTNGRAQRYTDLSVPVPIARLRERRLMLAGGTLAAAGLVLIALHFPWVWQIAIYAVFGRYRNKDKILMMPKCIKIRVILQVNFDISPGAVMDANSGEPWSETDISDMTHEIALGRTFAQTASFLCRDEDEGAAEGAATRADRAPGKRVRVVR